MARRCCLLCLLCSLSCSSLALGRQFLVAESEHASLTAPRVAYSTSSRSYLAAWEHQPSIDDYSDVHCQRVDHEGQLLGDPIELEAPRIAVEATWSAPDVACNTQDDEFLLVYAYYEEYYLVAYAGIRGRFIGSDGALGALVQIDPDGHRSGAAPAVVYNPLTNEYLVVWVRNQNQIWAQAVQADGTLKGPGLRIDPGVQSCDCPAVACGDDRYLVVWQQQDDTAKTTIKAHRVTVGSSGAALLGTVIDCEEADNSQIHPRVAPCSGASKYLVVWENAPADVNDSVVIVGQQIASDGATHDAFVIMSGGPPWPARPDVASAMATNGCFVMWEQPDVRSRRIATQYVSSDGRVWGSPQWVSDPLPLISQRPALILGGDGNGLAVWEHLIMGPEDPFPPEDPLPPPSLPLYHLIYGSVDPKWMAIRPIARIDQPAFLESICGVYDIIGEACVTGGSGSYKVEYRDAVDPESQWTTIGQSSLPVCGSDRLATWDTNPMVPGHYYLRLTVTGADDLEATDFVAVYVDDACRN